MPENFALYSSLYRNLPPDQMKSFVAVVPEISNTENGLVYKYEWSDLCISCMEMPKQQIQDHLVAFGEYIKKISSDHDQTRLITSRILETTLVVGIEIAPAIDSQGRTEELMGKLCGGLKAIMFYDRALYDYDSTLLLAPE